jgi:hypothetical protein
MVTVASAVHAESHAATRIGPARTAGQAAQGKHAMAREFRAALHLAGTDHAAESASSIEGTLAAPARVRRSGAVAADSARAALHTASGRDSDADSTRCYDTSKMTLGGVSTEVTGRALATAAA